MANDVRDTVSHEGVSPAPARKPIPPGPVPAIDARRENWRDAPAPAPLSAEELENWRRYDRTCPHHGGVTPCHDCRLIATIDAERARADAAEKDKAELIEIALNNAAARDSALERVWVLTEVLQDLADLQNGPPLLKYADEFEALMPRVWALLTVEPEADEEGGCPICEGGSGTPCNSHFGV